MQSKADIGLCATNAHFVREADISLNWFKIRFEPKLRYAAHRTNVGFAASNQLVYPQIL